jgi:hypothetical protein
MVNMVTLLPGKMVFMRSSSSTRRRSFGSCRSWALMYSHIFFTTWVRGHRSTPRNACIAAERWSPKREAPPRPRLVPPPPPPPSPSSSSLPTAASPSAAGSWASR